MRCQDVDVERRQRGKGDQESDLDNSERNAHKEDLSTDDNDNDKRHQGLRAVTKRHHTQFRRKEVCGPICARRW